MSVQSNDDTFSTADIVNPGRNTIIGEPETHQTPPQAHAAIITPPPAAAEPDYEQSAAPMAAPVPVKQESTPLFPEDELHNFRSRWDEVQTSFVDEPRQAVEHADSLVANVVKRIAEQFANEREQLEKQWDRGEDVNTEELRQAFRRYRAFFDRLLTF